MSSCMLKTIIVEGNATTSDPMDLLSKKQWSVKFSEDSIILLLGIEGIPRSVNIGFCNINRIAVFAELNGQWESVCDSSLITKNDARAMAKVPKMKLFQLDYQFESARKLKLVCFQFRHSKKLGPLVIQMLEVRGEAIGVFSQSPAPKKPDKAEVTRGRLYWKRLKGKIDKLCEDMGMKDFDARPEVKRGEMMCEAFEQSLGRELSNDDIGCMNDRILRNWAIIIQNRLERESSLKKEVKKEVKMNEVSKKEEESVSDDGILEISDYKPIIEIFDSPGEPGPSRFPQFPRETTFPCPLCQVKFEQDILHIHAAECQGTPVGREEATTPPRSPNRPGTPGVKRHLGESFTDHYDSPKSKVGKWQRDESFTDHYDSPRTNAGNWQRDESFTNPFETPKKKFKEPGFIEDDDTCGQCPTCTKCFEGHYIVEHVASCQEVLNRRLSPATIRQIKYDDLRNRRFRQRAKVNSLTGEERVVHDRFSNQPFRHNEEDIERCRLERYERELNKSPQPIRRDYPHFDRPSEPTQKCFVCTFEFLSREFREHVEKCATNSFR